MWICPKCKESIEDQFDSCWKCAGQAESATPANDLAWLYPLISLLTLLLFPVVVSFFISSTKRPEVYVTFGGALAATMLSGIAIWAFLRCPLRRWGAKAVTLLFLVGALFYGVISVGSFFIHLLGYEN